MGGGGAPSGGGRPECRGNDEPDDAAGGSGGRPPTAPTGGEPVAGTSGMQSATLRREPSRSKKRRQESTRESSSSDADDEAGYGRPSRTSTAKKPARTAGETTLSAGSLQPILEAVEKTVDLEPPGAAEQADDRAERTMPPGVEEYETPIRRDEPEPIRYRRIPDDNLSLPLLLSCRDTCVLSASRGGLSCQSFSEILRISEKV